MGFVVLPNQHRGMHVVSDDGYTCAAMGANAKFAALIAEAFNVARETGRTPSQLAERLASVESAIRVELAELERKDREAIAAIGCSEGKVPAAIQRLRQVLAAIAEAEGATP